MREFDSYGHFGFGSEQVKEAFATAGEAALRLGDLEKLAELVGFVDSLSPGSTNHFLRAHSSRFRAYLAQDADLAEADRLFRRSAGLLRELSTPFMLAVVQAEHAELILQGGAEGDARELVTEAREVFERLSAKPWLDRLDALSTGVAA
ncbi:MAG: hypothetical protein H0U03_00120 [Actinobacteria bacterium]|nr:hypothetical protein [Actinomycetota bacterium]